MHELHVRTSTRLISHSNSTSYNTVLICMNGVYMSFTPWVVPLNSMASVYSTIILVDAPYTSFDHVVFC